MVLECVERHVTPSRDYKVGDTTENIDAGEVKRLFKDFPGKFKIVKSMEIETKVPKKAPAKKRTPAKKTTK